MKKVSISLFAVAALVVALASAFTTAKFARTDYRMWAFDQVAGATQSGYNAAIDNPSLPTQDDKYNFVEDFIPTNNDLSNAGETIADYLSNNLKSCVGSTDICVVKILEDPSHQSTQDFGEVVDIQFGDLQ